MDLERACSEKGALVRRVAHALQIVSGKGLVDISNSGEVTMSVCDQPRKLHGIVAMPQLFDAQLSAGRLAHERRLAR